MSRARSSLVFWAAAASALGFAAPATAVGDARETVVLLHGLGRSERSMRPLAAQLSRAGYRVHNLDYPSRHLDVGPLVERIAQEIERCCGSAARLHFVGHSLGGLLVRAYLAEHSPANLGRVVMLAPPNHGSELADLLGGWPLVRRTLGPIAPALGTGPDALPARLPPPHFEVGVIAGTRSVNLLGSALLPDPNDGTVSLASASLEGMADFVAVPEAHTFIMRSRRVARLTASFLASGRFYPPASP